MSDDLLRVDCPECGPVRYCDEDIRVEVAMVAIVALERFGSLTARVGWVL
jgi:hypothetical protein